MITRRTMHKATLGSLLSAPALRRAAAQAGLDRLVIAGGIDPTGVNAIDVYTVFPDRSLMEHVGDTLVRQTRPGTLGSWMAESWARLDPVTYEFKLRRDVRFHNGEPFNAQSVKTFYDVVFDPAVVTPRRPNQAFVKEVQVVDDHTLRIVTRSPYPGALSQFIYVYGMPTQYLKEVGLEGYRRRPVGTGPYRITERVRDDHMTLTAFDGYWGGPQRFRQITYRPIPEAAARVAALLTGEVDMAMDVPPELRAMVERGRDLQVKSVLTGRVYLLLLNSIRPDYPTAKREVREAINYALNRDSLAQDIFGGAAAPSAWFNPQTFGVNPDLKPIPFEPSRARKLLADAGFPNGLDIELETSNGRYLKDKELAEAIAGQLGEVGIRVTVKTVEWGVMVRRLSTRTSAPIVLSAFGDYTGDPDAANKVVLFKDGVNGLTDDPVLESIMQRAATEMDEGKRLALMHEQQDHMRHSFPVAFLVRSALIAGTGPKLADWQPRPDERYYFFRNKFEEEIGRQAR